MKALRTATALGSVLLLTSILLAGTGDDPRVRLEKQFRRVAWIEKVELRQGKEAVFMEKKYDYVVVFIVNGLYESLEPKVLEDNRTKMAKTVNEIMRSGRGLMVFQADTGKIHKAVEVRPGGPKRAHR